MQMIWGALLTPDLASAPYLVFVHENERNSPANYKGLNPKVFQYSLGSLNEGAQGVCRLRFYEGHPIYVVWGAPDPKPK